jgi:hypothetical protein
MEDIVICLIGISVIVGLIITIAVAIHAIFTEDKRRGLR